ALRQHNVTCDQLVVSPDLCRFAAISRHRAAGKTTVAIHDIASGRARVSFEIPDGEHLYGKLLADGNYLLLSRADGFAEIDDGEKKMWLWDVADTPRLVMESERELTVSGDGQWLGEATRTGATLRRVGQADFLTLQDRHDVARPPKVRFGTWSPGVSFSPD